MTYLALTIGPIYKTLKDARKTRELWGGSYLFSYIMKEIIHGFKDRKFIVPYIQEKSLFESGNEIGLFHDRFIFKAQEGDLEKLHNHVDEVLHTLSENINVDYAFLKHYLQISIVEKELKEKQNPIKEMNPYLDTAELFYEVSQYEENLLTNMLQGNNSFLTKEAFGKKKPFPSLPAIAMNDIAHKVDLNTLLNDDDDIFQNEVLKAHLKPYHKYYAIIQADGDSMGKVIDTLKVEKDFQDFSKKLFVYGKKAHEIIKSYGGETIFAGGDDLLFFAPVVSGDQTIFDLCDTISNDFDERFSGTEATLSFGIAIRYHKYPLYEALEESRMLLREAKKGEKNSIAFSVIKHSGQKFGSIVQKSKTVLYEHFKTFSSNIHGGEESDNFLHSLHHKIENNKHLLKQIASNEAQLQNFFDNNFNEKEHEEYREFFKVLVSYIHASYHVSEKDTNPLDRVYATLRFIKFVQGDKA